VAKAFRARTTPPISEIAGVNDVKMGIGLVIFINKLALPFRVVK